jgi:transitional endoplasmic reticulum ATPase
MSRSTLLAHISRIRVTNGYSNDSSVNFLLQNTLRSLSLSPGDTVQVKSKSRRTTVLTALACGDVNDGNASMNGVVRENLDVKDGDVLNIQQCLDITYVSILTC